MSSAMTMKIQHDPQTKLKKGMLTIMKLPTPAHSPNHATKYPAGVFQSKGHLFYKFKVHFRQTISQSCFSLATNWISRTTLELIECMTPFPNPKCNSWQLCRAEWVIQDRWRLQKSHKYQFQLFVRFFRLYSCTSTLNAFLQEIKCFSCAPKHTSTNMMILTPSNE